MPDQPGDSNAGKAQPTEQPDFGPQILGSSSNDIRARAEEREITRVASVIETKAEEALKSKDPVPSLERISEEFAHLQHDPKLREAVLKRIDQDCDKNPALPDANLWRDEHGKTRVIEFTHKPAVQKDGQASPAAGSGRVIQIPLDSPPKKSE